MSLLLEALKKAERDKQGHDSVRQETAGHTLSLSETAAEATIPGYPVPGGALELVQEEEFVPPDLSRQHLDPVRQESAPEPAPERAAAQNMFAAKQGGMSGASIGKTGKLLMAAGVVFIAIAGGAYYVWQEVTRTSGIGQPQVAGQAGAGTIPPIRMPAPAPITSPPVPPAATAPVAKEATPPPAQSSAKDASLSPTLSRQRERGQLAPFSAGRSGGGGEVAAESAIRIQRKQNTNEVPPLLAAAYRAYLAGDLDTARQQYRKQLQNDPRNKDAMLGLAAIAVHMRLPGEAQAYYLRILELDPRDPSAIAGMAGLGQQVDSGQTESRLKILLAQQPDAAMLHFTLGNHYADQSRWGEAQQAFFRAFSIDSTNAEYAFNLAVSLDHLNQDKLAAEYYGKALALTGATPAGFDRALAARRIAELMAGSR